jgi:thiosulfate dehydrogenase
MSRHASLTRFVAIIALALVGAIMAGYGAAQIAAQEATGDPVRGGLLYDAWWAAIGADAPSDDHPLWATQTTNTRSGSDTWRCKECHGWDYKGADGAYGSGSHFTGFPGVLGAAAMPADEVRGWLTGQANPDHDFSDVMDDYAIDALVVFVQQEARDTAPYINADKTVNGDADAGQRLFGGTCAKCHGADGKTFNFGSDDEPEYIGTLANDNPWEVFHKISFGQPGEPMPNGVGLGWTPEDIANVIAYAQTLPTE